MVSQLCGSCKAVTFYMLLNGFDHPKTLEGAAASGRTCMLCRLMVCTFSKLQLKSPWNPYSVDKEYDAVSGILHTLPAVNRMILGSEDLPYFESMEKPIGRLSWKRDEYIADFNLGSKPVLKHGNFGGGGTIQASAANGSYYYSPDMVPFRDIGSRRDDRNYDMLDSWLRDCMETHNECRAWSQRSRADYSSESVALPARLVDVGSHVPCLVETGGKQGKYLTLSHRWGNHQVKTTKQNVGHFMRHLPMNNLPQTFKDAIEVTRRLNFRYIWIDSLCIVQDDDEDWRRESGKMGDIFESSSCTIAAVHALDDDSNDRGLFLPRNNNLAVEISCPIKKEPLPRISAKIRHTNGRNCVWKYTWLKKDPEKTDIASIIRHNTIVLRPRIPGLWYQMQQSKWYNRGWVYQERILSRRLIYYTRDKLYWQCLREDGEEQEPRRNLTTRDAWLSSKSAAINTAKNFAKELARDYATCELTYWKDKLIAIEGICRKLQDRYSHRFHAGILDDGIGESLLWHASEDSMLRYNDFHAPSWTWAGRSGKPSYFIPEILESVSEVLISNISFQTQKKCEFNNPHGLCKDTCISGAVSFIGPVGKLFRSRMLSDMNTPGHDGSSENAPNDVLIWIFGSGIHASGISTPRVDAKAGTLIRTPRQLYVPRHTELLLDSHGHYIVGYLIPDERGLHDRPISILCAGISRKKREGPLEMRPPGGYVEGYRYDLETCIDIIGLETVADDPRKYRRVGRGRVLCNSWLAGCSEEVVTIV